MKRCTLTLILLIGTAGILPYVLQAQIVAKPRSEAPAKPQSGTSAAKPKTSGKNKTSGKTGAGKSRASGGTTRSVNAQSVVGTWKDEETLISLYSDGTVETTWENGRYSQGHWSIEGKLLTITYHRWLGSDFTCEHEILSLSANTMKYRCHSYDVTMTATRVDD